MRAPKRSKNYGLFKSCQHLSWDKCDCPWLGRFRTVRYVNLGEWAGVAQPAKARAVDILVEVKKAIKAGVFRKEGRVLAPAQQGEALTFGDFLRRYRSYLVEDRGITDLKNNNLHIILNLWERDLGSLTLALAQDPMVWETWLAKRKAAKGWTTNTPWNRFRAHGKAMFAWGLRPKIGLVVKNPFLEIDKKQETTRKPPRLDDGGVTEAELIAAIELAYPPIPEHPKLHGLRARRRTEMYRRIIAALDTGLRRTELLEIQLKHVNFKTWEITLPTSKGKTKTGEEEKVFAMTERLQELLTARRFIGPEGYVFGKENGRKAKNFRRAWHAVFKAAGLQPGRNGNFTWHSLRHEFISQLADMTDNPLDVKELARHRDLSTTQTYMKAKDERLKALLAGKVKKA